MIREHTGLIPPLIPVRGDGSSGPAAPETYEPIGPWWNQLQSVQTQFEQKIFTHTLPHEQLIVGQDDTRAIRFYNFGAPLTREQQTDCGRFVDLMTQCFGDDAYRLLTDVVIGQFSPSSRSARMYGLSYAGTGLAAVNDGWLRYNPAPREGAGGSWLLQVLCHEAAGHLLHGDYVNDPQVRQDVETFAAATGWDMEAMHRDSYPLWWVIRATGSGDAIMQRYAPQHMAPHVVALPNGGSPSHYGTTNPLESLSETSLYTILGGRVIQSMYRNGDAWLEFAGIRLGRWLAAPRDWTPATVRRRTGRDITYPRPLLEAVWRSRLTQQTAAAAA